MYHEVRERLSKLERVLSDDPRGLRAYSDPFLMPLSGFAKLEKNPNHFEELVEQTSADDVALFATTSGTTGIPKLAMLTHRNLLSMAQNLLAVDPLEPGDELVSFLPLAWVGEQMMSVSCVLHVPSGSSR